MLIKNKRNIIQKIIAVMLTVLILTAALSSCAIRPQKAGKLALTPVGNVGAYEVLYEELYYYATNFIKDRQDKYSAESLSDAETKKAYIAEFESFFAENVLLNYAILTLCADVGLTLDMSGLKDEISEEIEAIAEDDADGNRTKYLKKLEEAGMTDHYMRFYVGIELVYAKIVAKYIEKGILKSDDAAVRQYIEENFIRTRHVMIPITDIATAESQASIVLNMLENGSDMFDMIKSSYNKDSRNNTLNGYYFAKGSMEQAYEDAALALDSDEISGTVYAKGRDLAGNSVDCIYIIQRLPLEGSYIAKHLSTLADEAYNAIVFDHVENVKGNLSFVKNDFYKTLDLTNLETPKSPEWIYTVVIIAGSVITTALLVLMWITFYKKRRKSPVKRLPVKSK